MKRFIILVMISLLLLSLSVLAEGIPFVNYYYHTLEDDTVEISNYFGNNVTLVIPSKLDGKTVTSIGDNAFWDCVDLTFVTIPDSVTHIGSWVFADCTNLTSVSIPYSVKKIDINPFVYCYNLEEINVSPEHEYFAVVDGVLFDKTEKLLVCCLGTKTGEYIIPQDICAVGDDAFSGCDGLTSVTIPNSVTSIGNDAFSGCSGLTSVTIPDSVKKIGTNPFAYSYNLEEIKVSPNQEYLTVTDGVLFCKPEGRLVCCLATKTGEYAIPQGIRAIDYEAFSGCDVLNSVTIPYGVTSIGIRAFSWCVSLTSVTIPDSVLYIGEDAFAECAEELTIIVPRDSYAAQYCKENGLNYQYTDI